MSKAYVHESAVVDEGVTLGEGVRIWHFVHVSAGASIGAGSALGQNVYVGKGVRVGARVKVQNNVSLYESVEIHDDVFLGPSCVFTNVINPRSFVERKHEFKATVVGRGASIGANATIVCGHAIGEYAFVGAGSTVTRDVPPHALVVGSPARRTGWMCRCGEKLPKGVEPTCAACGARYLIDGERCAEAPQGASEGAARPIPLLDLEAQNAPLMGEYRAAFERVMKSGQFILGPEVEAFERELCAAFGYRHAIGVSSGTDALLLALTALGIGPGDEVITSPFSFFATAGCIARVGAKPVFVDIDPVTFNLDPERLAAKLTERTKAIVPVHLFGQAADVEAIRKVAEPRRVAVIEDAAQALSATRAGVAVGTLGTLSCFSFFPSKNLGGFGDGGLVTTARDDLAARARVLRSHGGEPKYFHKLLGGNFRLDALQAALLRVKLPSLARYTEARRVNARFYDQAFAAASLGDKLVTPRAVDPGHAYNQYVVRTPLRDRLRRALLDAGIGCEIYYPVGLHLQECFAGLGYRAGDMPETERATLEVLALPVHGELSEAARARVVETVVRALR